MSTIWPSFPQWPWICHFLYTELSPGVSVQPSLTALTQALHTEVEIMHPLNFFSTDTIFYAFFPRFLCGSSQPLNWNSTCSCFSSLNPTNLGLNKGQRSLIFLASSGVKKNLDTSMAGFYVNVTQVTVDLKEGDSIENASTMSVCGHIYDTMF